MKGLFCTILWVVLFHVFTSIWNHDKCWYMAIVYTASPHSYLALKISSSWSVRAIASQWTFSKPGKRPPTAHLDCCGWPASGSLQYSGKPQRPRRYWIVWNAKLDFVILASFLYIALNTSASPKEKGQKLTLINHWICSSGSSLSWYFFFLSVKLFPSISIYNACNVPYWWFICGV